MSGFAFQVVGVYVVLVDWPVLRHNLRIFEVHIVFCFWDMKSYSWAAFQCCSLLVVFWVPLGEPRMFLDFFGYWSRGLTDVYCCTVLAWEFVNQLACFIFWNWVFNVKEIFCYGSTNGPKFVLLEINIPTFFLNCIFPGPYVKQCVVWSKTLVLQKVMQ